MVPTFFSKNNVGNVGICVWYLPEIFDFLQLWKIKNLGLQRPAGGRCLHLARLKSDAGELICSSPPVWLVIRYHKRNHVRANERMNGRMDGRSGFGQLSATTSLKFTVGFALKWMPFIMNLIFLLNLPLSFSLSFSLYFYFFLSLHLCLSSSIFLQPFFLAVCHTFYLSFISIQFLHLSSTLCPLL